MTLTGNDVAAERRRAELTQKTLAGYAQIDVPTLVAIERNRIRLTQEEYQKLIDVAKAPPPVTKRTSRTARNGNRR